MSGRMWGKFCKRAASYSHGRERPHWHDSESLASLRAIGDSSGPNFMHNKTVRAVLASACLLMGSFARPEAAASAINNSDWPAWRGPTRDGIAPTGQNPLIHWGESEGILWKVPLPGRGHGSPTVVADRIFLAVADPAKQSQSILCLDRQTGKTVWQTVVHSGGADPGHHSNSSAA
jgi:outer membrane protein assembly factor BamB